MKKGYIYALLTALCWSTAGLFVKNINQSAFVIAGSTGLIALIFNQIVNRGKIKISKFTILIGICQLIMHLSFVFANQLTSVGNAIVLQYSSMIFVLIYQSIDKRKLPNFYQYIIIGMAAIGMIIFFLDSFSLKGNIGNLLAVLSGAFFGLQFYLNTKDKADPGSSLLIQYFLSIMIMIPMVMTNPIKFSSQDIIFIILSGVFQTGLSGIFFAKCIVEIPAFSANVICMSEVIIAPIWAFIFLKEVFTPYTFIGALIIVCALILNIYMEYTESRNVLIE